MRILLVTPMPPQTKAPGAIPLVLHAQLTGLQQRGHAVSLVTVANQEPGEQEAVGRLQAEGVPVHAVVRTEPQGMQRWSRRWRMGSTWLRGKYPWRTVWFWEPEVQRILDTQLASGAYDLVLVEDNAMGIYRYRSQAPVVFTEHEVRRPRNFDWRFWQRGNPFLRFLEEIDWKRWQAYQASVWRKFDRIQVFTQRDAQAIRQLAPALSRRVLVNPFGIEAPAETSQRDEDANTVLFAGNYTHAPNVDAALWLGKEILPLLRQRCPEVQLKLVGIYPPEEVRRLQSRNIAVTGAVPEIEPYLKQAAVVLAPVRIGGGMRMKVLQAMAVGKAVVTTPRGAEGFEYTGEQPPLAIAESAEAFAEATARLLASPQARADLGRGARRFVSEHFSPDAYARRIEATYSELVEMKASGR